MAYEKAKEASTIREQRNKKKFDLRVRVQDLQPGDRVLLCNLGVPGKHKLADRWRSQPYIVCKPLPGLPVYQIQPEGKTGPLKTWHRKPFAVHIRGCLSTLTPLLRDLSVPDAEA